MSRMTRRRLLGGIAGAGLVGALGAVTNRSLATPDRRDLIRDENENSGTSD